MAAMSVVVAPLLALLVAATVPAAVNAQANLPPCVQKLAPCLNYLKSTKPPSSCCTPLKDAVQNDLPCLCPFLNNPTLLKSFGIDAKQVLQLPKHCGITSNTSICSESSAPAPAPAPGTGPPGTGPPATPGSGDGSSSNGLTTMGLTGIASLIMLWLSLWA